LSIPVLQARGLWKVFGARAPLRLAALGPALSGPAAAAALQAEGLVPAVCDVTLSVGQGEIFVIMGLSGSGKSTLVRCLSRLIEPTAGQVIFQGRDLMAASEAEMTQIRRHKMGMVFQHFALLPHLTALQNVAFPLEVQGVARAQRDDRARAMIALVGLSGREGFYPRELSGGQQQRVGIARSLAGDPDLWFLDEPFSALDPLIRRELQDEFLRLQAQVKKTIIFITHDIDEAVRLADRIAIMKDGLVVQAGTPEEIVLTPATDYVRDFTRAVPRAKVMRIGTLVEPGTAEGPPLAPGQRLAEVAPLFAAGAEALPVADQGRPLGRLTRAKVVAELLRSPG
jgi:glycine betaine/proline transport system ATP-binding protein